MSEFGNHIPEETGEGFEDWVNCPECLEQGRETAVRSHLINAHGWTDEAVEDHFGNHPSGDFANEAHASMEIFPELQTSNVEDGLESARDETDLCDCPSEAKESQVIQKSTGATLGPLGGNRGNGVPIIICTDCGQKFELDSTSGGLASGFGWD